MSLRAKRSNLISVLNLQDPCPPLWQERGYGGEVIKVKSAQST
jgi:hypothetical protein